MIAPTPSLRPWADCLTWTGPFVNCRPGQRPKVGGSVTRATSGLKAYSRAWSEGVARFSPGVQSETDQSETDYSAGLSPFHRSTTGADLFATGRGRFRLDSTPAAACPARGAALPGIAIPPAAMRPPRRAART